MLAAHGSSISLTESIKHSATPSQRCFAAPSLFLNGRKPRRRSPAPLLTLSLGGQEPPLSRPTHECLALLYLLPALDMRVMRYVTLREAQSVRQRGSARGPAPAPRSSSVSAASRTAGWPHNISTESQRWCVRLTCISTSAGAPAAGLNGVRKRAADLPRPPRGSPSAGAWGDHSQSVLSRPGGHRHVASISDREIACKFDGKWVGILTTRQVKGAAQPPCPPPESAAQRQDPLKLRLRQRLRPSHGRPSRSCILISMRGSPRIQNNSQGAWQWHRFTALAAIAACPRDPARCPAPLGRAQAGR